MEQNLNIQTLRAQDGNILRIECRDTLPSTVALAREYVKQGYPDRYVVFAERQESTDLTETVLKKGETTDRGVFLTLILRPSLFPSQAVFLGAMTAVALANAMQEHTSKKLGIGWVSSLYCDGKKIGATAIEGKLDNFGAFEYLLITFSVSMSEQNFPPRLTDLVRKVFASESTSVPILLAKSILDNFFLLYPYLKSPMKYMDAYRQRFLLRGKKVTVLDDGTRRRMKVIGIDNANGTLLVESRSGELKKISSQKNVLLPKVIR